MDDLASLGYPNVNKLYLFDFSPGHGGDFFISLASKCARDHVNSWNTWEEMEERLDQFRETKLMPGNNIGGKLINYNTTEDFKEQIFTDLKRIGGSDATKMSFCTHPIGDNKDVKIRSVLEHCFPGTPIQQVALDIESPASEYFTMYNYYNDDSDFSKQHLRRQRNENSRWIFWNDPENTIVLDQMTLMFEDRAGLKQRAQAIGDINDEFYDRVIEVYSEVKVNPFLKWWNKRGIGV
jgi:hypothetical protein